MAIEGYASTGEPIRAAVKIDPETGKIVLRSRIGIVVHYVSGTPTENIDRICVLNDDSPLEEQLKSDELNNQRISGIYMYTSEDQAAANDDVFYSIFREDDSYSLDDLYYEEEFYPLYKEEIYVAWDYTSKGITRTRVTKLDADKPLDVQVKKYRLKNAYLCLSKQDAEFVKFRWDVNRSKGIQPIR